MSSELTAGVVLESRWSMMGSSATIQTIQGATHKIEVPEAMMLHAGDRLDLRNCVACPSVMLRDEPGRRWVCACGIEVHDSGMMTVTADDKRAHAKPHATGWTYEFTSYPAQLPPGPRCYGCGGAMEASPIAGQAWWCKCGGQTDADGFFSHFERERRRARAFASQSATIKEPRKLSDEEIVAAMETLNRSENGRLSPGLSIGGRYVSREDQQAAWSSVLAAKIRASDEARAAAERAKVYGPIDDPDEA